MRAITAVFVVVAFLLTPAARGGEKELLDKFKRQNEQGRDKVKADVEAVLEKAKELEKDEPVKALLVLQLARDRMLERGLLTAKEDRALAEPLWERIQVLRVVVRGKYADELQSAVADYKEYLARMNEQFFELRKALIAPNKEVPRGGPAFFAFINGKLAAGWLSEPPVYVVHATINDELRTFGPGLVTGLHTPQGFYLYEPANKHFVLLPNPEFFLTAIASYPPARKSGFWITSETPPLPAGIFQQTPGALGTALFGRSAGMLMNTWGGPGGQTPETIVRGRVKDPTTARLYRDVLIDIMVQEVFRNVRKIEQHRFRDVIQSFLERRPIDDPLTPEEVVQLSDLIADISSDRRSDAVAFTLVLNRLFEQGQRLRKQ